MSANAVIGRVDSRTERISLVSEYVWDGDTNVRVWVGCVVRVASYIL